MDKDKERQKEMYESPVTKETRVNLESGICAGSVIEDNDSNGNAKIDGHDVNTDFGSSGWTNDEWD